MEFHDIAREGMAAETYRLSFLSRTGEFALDVRSDVVGLLDRELSRERGNTPRQHWLRFDLPDSHPGVSLLEPLTPAGGAKKGWCRWVVQLPMGTADEEGLPVYDWSGLYAVTRCLGPVLALLMLVVPEVPAEGSEARQLMRISGLGDGESRPGGCGFNVGVLPHMQAWLATQDCAKLAKVMSTAMARAISRMGGLKRNPGPGFMGIGVQFLPDPVAPQLVGGGNCACMGVDMSSSFDGGEAREGKGYELRPHNIDSPVHQLTILAGIATMWGMAVV